MKVNILLSTYNGEQYLKEQVKSIQDQTYQDWQLLIRDDGSTDGTVKIIQELVAQDERIRFINQGAIENLGKLMGIPTPVRIESFDNSNIMGTSPVSAMVVFENGKPNKKEYRKYKIKTVEGPDDYASMREVIRRRYSRVKRDGLTLPDLIIMDGGQGQVNVAKDVLRKELNLSIPVAGLQKNDKHQTNELLFGDPLQVIDLPRQSEEFFLLHRIQDEVHRFAITFHRDKRSKRQVASALDTIKGIGEKTKTALLKEFKSVKRIKEASLEEISAIAGEAKAKIIKEALPTPEATNRQ